MPLDNGWAAFESRQETNASPVARLVITFGTEFRIWRKARQPPLLFCSEKYTLLRHVEFYFPIALNILRQISRVLGNKVNTDTF